MSSSVLAFPLAAPLAGVTASPSFAATLIAFDHAAFAASIGEASAFVAGLQENAAYKLELIEK